MSYRLPASRTRIPYSVWSRRHTDLRARSGEIVPRWGGHGLPDLQYALRGALDPLASVRARITPELRSACEILLKRDQESHRGFPAPRHLLIDDLVAAVDPKYRSSPARARIRARRLFGILVALKILRPFGRGGDTFDPPFPGALAQLLRDPPRRDHGALGKLVARHSR